MKLQWPLWRKILRPTNLQHKCTISAFLYASQEGWKQQLLLWVMVLFKNCVRNVRNMEKMVAHEPPLSLVQDKA